MVWHAGEIARSRTRHSNGGLNSAVDPGPQHFPRLGPAQEPSSGGERRHVLKWRDETKTKPGAAQSANVAVRSSAFIRCKRVGRIAANDADAASRPCDFKVPNDAPPVYFHAEILVG